MVLKILKFLLGAELSPIDARKQLVKQTGYSFKTVRNVLVEKELYGEVIDNSGPRNYLSHFEKLSIEQRDAIRKTVGFIQVFYQCYQL